MKTGKGLLFDEYIRTPQEKRCHQQEMAWLECTELIHKLMLEHHISKKQLAEKSGYTQQEINDFLDDNLEDFNIKGFAAILFAAGFKFKLEQELLKKWEK